MSLLQRQHAVASTSLESSSPLSYVACHLYRPDVLDKHSWDLWFALEAKADGRSLVVKALHPSFDVLLQWAWVTSSPPETSIMTNQSYGNTMWKSYFALLPPVPHSSPRSLVPGDVILSINGIPSAAFGNSIDEVTKYLQRCTNQLFVVAIRNENNSSSSTDPSARSSKKDQPSGYPPQQTTSWYPYAPVTPPAHPMSSYYGHHQAPPRELLRVVTPSRSELSPQRSSSFNASATSKRKLPLMQNKSTPKLAHKATCIKPSPEVQRVLQLTMEAGKNPMFRKSRNGGSTYDNYLMFLDNHDDLDSYDPEEGTQSNNFMLPIDSKERFGPWLQSRKQRWRSKWNIKTSVKTNDILASLSLPLEWTNTMFHKHNDCDDGDDDDDDDDDHNEYSPDAITFCDNYTFDPHDGSRSGMFLFPISSGNFQAWLNHRKWKWRSRWKITTINDDLAIDPQWSGSGLWTNPMFSTTTSKEEDEKTAALAYEDNLLCDLPDEYCGPFVATVNTSNFATWLKDRKQKWRSNWKPYELQADDEELYCHQSAMQERLESSIRYDFWADRYTSFDGWLKDSKDKWKKSYSWNTRKRKRIQQVCEEVVHFPSSHDPLVAQQQLQSWLRVRKNQWRMLRRKRQRRWEEQEDQAADATATDTATNVPSQHLSSTEKHATATAVTGDLRHIDALLEEEERQKKNLAEQKKCRQPLDLSFLFVPSLGLSDDLCKKIVEYLDCSEHGKLLCISKKYGEGLKSRAYMWQLLCHPNWHLPRRPRKPWYKLYLSKLRTEVFASRKQWDDLLTNVSEVLFKGDQLKLAKKLIEGAEKKFAFTVDYVSGVVCERNSILNLAVIHKRHKIVRWLVEEKQADIETSDRGHFTPLINAAWGGDKLLVRFLLSHGADRSKVGTGHYTEALAPSDFGGLTAEGWARKKGHTDIAELIRVGL